MKCLSTSFTMALSSLDITMLPITSQTAEIFYQAYLNHDSQFEGIFFMGVKTTGIFCRPGCKAKAPKRQNVEFFRTAHEAVDKAYRPCKRCHPMQLRGELPAWVQQALDMVKNKSGDRVSDTELRAGNIDPARLRRWFKKNRGMTFQAYQRLGKISNAYSRLKQGDKVIESALENGYNSLSGFHQSFKKHTGFNPSSSKKQKIIQLTRLLSPLGPMLAAASDEGLCLLEFADRKTLDKQLGRISKRINAEFVAGDHALFGQLQKQLDEYFAQQRREFDIQLNMVGTDFQKSAWTALAAIPYGSTRSYQQQAAVLGKPAAVRAVGSANGVNAIAIIIPCHRVIGKDGGLSGYGGDVWRKQYLINLEKKNS